MEVNPDHYKYMPHSPEEEGRETPQEQPETAASEEVVIVEEVISGPINGAKDDTTAETKEDSARATRAGMALEWLETDGLLKFFYNLCGPLLIPSVATLLIFTLSIFHIIAPGAALPYTLTVLGATCFIPLIALFVLLRVGAIRSFSLPEPRERVVPYVVMILALGAMTIFFAAKGAAPWLWGIYCGGAAIGLVNLLLNFRLRVSNHCSAWAGLLAVFIVVNNFGFPQYQLFWWVVGTMLVGGLVGTLSVVIGRHTIWEVLTGYATGFLGIILFSLLQ